jgi:hypothetical protein
MEKPIPAAIRVKKLAQKRTLSFVPVVPADGGEVAVVTERLR